MGAKEASVAGGEGSQSGWERREPVWLRAKGASLDGGEGSQSGRERREPVWLGAKGASVVGGEGSHRPLARPPILREFLARKAPKLAILQGDKDPTVGVHGGPSFDGIGRQRVDPGITTVVGPDRRQEGLVGLAIGVP